MLRKKIHNVQFLKPKNLKKCMKLNWNFQSGQVVGNVHGYFQELNNPFSLSGMKFGMGNVQVAFPWMRNITTWTVLVIKEGWEALLTKSGKYMYSWIWRIWTLLFEFPVILNLKPFPWGLSFSHLLSAISNYFCFTLRARNSGIHLY